MKPPAVAERPSKLDPYKAKIDSILAGDQKAWHKQRHTAKRIWERLRDEEEGFDCSYSTVRRYVRRRKRELALAGEYDERIVNDTLDEAAAALSALVGA